MSLSRRIVTSVSWNFVANTASGAVLVVRMILLTRMLTPAIYGAYALAFSIIALTSILPEFGMGQAFIHRAPQTMDEHKAASVHLTLRLLFTVIWAAVLLLGTLLFAQDDLRVALLVLVPLYLGIQLTQTPRLILQRRIDHRRLATADVVEVLLTSAVALALAWNGAGIWALLATDVVTLGVTVYFLYIYRPIWRPRLLWDKPLMRYYLNFGSRSFVAEALLRATDRVDDLWTGFYLGQPALGIYSRAYTFATFPRKLLAVPLNAVAGGTYAELKTDRHRLSQAFFRNNAFLVRSGFLFAGVFALLGPALILLLGEQWSEMLTPFRLMLVFVLLDPIRLTIGLLFVAVGEPQMLARARAVQLAILVVGLFTLGEMWGVDGVALAVDIMLLAGIGLLLHQAHDFVDFKTWRLFLVPVIAFVLAVGTAFALSRLVSRTNPWLITAVQLLAFAGTYLVVWLAAEWRDTRRMLRELRSVVLVK